MAAAFASARCASRIGRCTCERCPASRLAREELLARLVEHARRADLDSLLATILSENVGSVRLAGDAGFSFVRRSGTSAEYEMCLTS
jgi:L-amino acid N-acyltransferase YncA